MTLPRDYARCMGHDIAICVDCARYVKNNYDPVGERVVFADFKPELEEKLSGFAWRCSGRIPRTKERNDG